MTKLVKFLVEEIDEEEMMNDERLSDAVEGMLGERSPLMTFKYADDESIFFMDYVIIFMRVNRDGSEREAEFRQISKASMKRYNRARFINEPRNALETYTFPSAEYSANPDSNINFLRQNRDGTRRSTSWRNVTPASWSRYNRVMAGLPMFKAEAPVAGKEYFKKVIAENKIIMVRLDGSSGKLTFYNEESLYTTGEPKISLTLYSMNDDGFFGDNPSYEAIVELHKESGFGFEHVYDIEYLYFTDDAKILRELRNII